MFFLVALDTYLGIFPCEHTIPWASIHWPLLWYNIITYLQNYLSWSNVTNISPGLSYQSANNCLAPGEWPAGVTSGQHNLCQVISLLLHRVFLNMVIIAEIDENGWGCQTLKNNVLSIYLLTLSFCIDFNCDLRIKAIELWS